MKPTTSDQCGQTHACIVERVFILALQLTKLLRINSSMSRRREYDIFVSLFISL